MIACFLCFMFAFLVRQELQRQEREQGLPQDFSYHSDQTHCHMATARQLAEHRSHLNINAGAESFANVDNGAATGLDAPPPPVFKKNAFLRNPLFRDSKVCPHQNLYLKYRRKCSNIDCFTVFGLISKRINRSNHDLFSKQLVCTYIFMQACNIHSSIHPSIDTPNIDTCIHTYIHMHIRPCTGTRSNRFCRLRTGRDLGQTCIVSGQLYFWHRKALKCQKLTSCVCVCVCARARVCICVCCIDS